jgi:hypothetical protein
MRGIAGQFAAMLEFVPERTPKDSFARNPNSCSCQKNKLI